MQAPENKRFHANGDVFYIRCYQNATQVFEKAYAGIRDLKKEKYKVIALFKWNEKNFGIMDFLHLQVYIVDDTESFDKFGRRRKTAEVPVQPSRYSIDILAFDSASRTMFMRHMPRTVELMNKIGYEILYGYTKVFLTLRRFP